MMAEFIFHTIKWKDFSRTYNLLHVQRLRVKSVHPSAKGTLLSKLDEILADPSMSKVVAHHLNSDPTDEILAGLF